jgi:hypothetical protein
LTIIIISFSHYSQEDDADDGADDAHEKADNDLREGVLT